LLTHRKLNLWNANCGASFEWVGRAINPYLGFMTGWLMITGTLIGSLTPVTVLGPNVLAVFGSSSTSTWPNIGIATGICVLMLAIAIIGIRPTARLQVGIAVVEYVILIGFSIAGLIWVLSHHAGSFPITSHWFSLNGIGGKGSLAAGFLIAVFISAMGGSGWGKVMTLALALSVIAATGTGIVLGARILYGMAGQRVLPAFIGNVSPKYSPPIVASVVCGVFLIAITWIYLLATSVQNAFNDVLDVSAILYAAFYVLTALAAMTYYRRRIMSSAMNLVTLGILPLAAVVFLVWMGVRNLQINLSAASRWSLVAVVGVGLLLMLIARYGLRSPFFSIPRESDDGAENASR